MHYPAPLACSNCLCCLPHALVVGFHTRVDAILLRAFHFITRPSTHFDHHFTARTQLRNQRTPHALFIRKDQPPSCLCCGRDSRRARQQHRLLCYGRTFFFVLRQHRHRFITRCL